MQKVASNNFSQVSINICLAFPLFLSTSDHNSNAALRLVYGPPAMSASDVAPVLPPNAVTETNQETLAQLKHDLAWISENELSGADSYRTFWYDEQGRPFGG